jgi:hypothetical protein
MEEKKLSFEEELKQIHDGYKRISKKTGIKMKELIPTIMIRELVIMNNQLRAVHEHLDLMEERTQGAAQHKGQEKKR